MIHRIPQLFLLQALLLLATIIGCSVVVVVDSSASSASLAWRARPSRRSTTSSSSLSSLPGYYYRSSQQQHALSTTTTVATATRKSTTKQQSSSSSSTTPKRRMTAQQMQLFNLFSGGIAGTVSSILTNPLEVVKTQLQASSCPEKKQWASVASQIWKKSGVRGFFRGLPPTLVGIIPSRSIYFYTYQWYSSVFEKTIFSSNSNNDNDDNDGTNNNPNRHANALLSGLLAGLTSNTLTNPIWMIRTRMQLYATPLIGTVAKICQQDGLAGFYKGITASYWGCTEGALQFVLYEQWKHSLLARKKKQKKADTNNNNNNNDDDVSLTKLEYFVSAAISKAVASIVTYPHEVARTRLRELGGGTGMWNTIFDIGRAEGTAGLYAGMGVHLVKVVPNSAFMFLTYELVRTWLKNHVEVIMEE